MNKFDNSKTKQFIKSLSSLCSLEADDNDLVIRSKFNFSYFDPSQQAGQDFNDWSPQQQCCLLNRLKEYTTKPLEYWRNERVGKGGLKMLANYGAFPAKSSFTHPKHVPHQAEWARFRLGSKLRLIGFTVPAELHRIPHNKLNELFDKNTFYVVFLDREHRFYIKEDD
ncbi:MAG: hypothetical protein PHE96_07315 [Methylococcales bacterium]|nr:hypothetical protein [Methylococcales bacterium]MDD5105616.1 hypothetical protein [Desulfuromonadaceae bacterium]